MTFKNPYWSNKLKMGSLQRYILVHSILYYELSESIILDSVFDANAMQLVKLQNENKEEAKLSEYAAYFKGFDGSTGFDLYDKMTKKDKEYLTGIALTVLQQYKSGKGSEKGVK